jgi:hypothetical protein
MGDERTVEIRITAKNLTDQELSAARRSLAGLGTEAKKAQESAHGLSSAAAKLSGIVAGIGFAALAKQAIDLGSKWNDLHNATQLETDALQKLDYAGQMMGVSLETMTTGIFQMQKGMAENRPAIEKLVGSWAAFRQLGPEQQMALLIEKIHGIKDPAEQAAAGAQIFSKSWKDLRGVTDELGSLMAQAERLGLVLSETTIANLDAMGDTLDTVRLQGRALSANILSNLRPAFDSLLQVSEPVGGFFKHLGNLFVYLDYGMAQSAERLYEWKAAIFETLSSVASAAGKFGEAAVFKTWADEAKKAAQWQKDFVNSLGAAIDRSMAPASKTPQGTRPGGGSLAPTKAELDATASAASAFEAMQQKVRLGYGNITVAAQAALKAMSAKDRVSDLAWMEDAAADAIKLAAELEKVTIPLSKDWTTEARKWSPVLRQNVIPPTKDWNESLSDVAQSLSQLSQIAGGTFGGIVQGLATVVSAADAAAKSVKAIGEGKAQGGVGGTISMVAGYLGVAGAALQAGKAIAGLFGAGGPTEYEKRVRANTAALVTLREGMLKLYGGMHNLAIEADAVGINIREAFTWDDAAALQGVLDDLTARTKLLDETLDKYGLSWTDLGENIRAIRFTDIVNGLLDDMGRLRQAGVPFDTAVGGMSGSLNQLILDAVKTGQKIPPALQPLLETMIRAGKLTDAAARAMLGLAADTMPSLADIKEAADRYGLSLDQLGPKVQQLKLTDAADQAIKDWKLLTQAGAPIEALIGGITGTLKDSVTAALGFGSALPAGMKPILDSLAAGVPLTEEMKQKLIDLSTEALKNGGTLPAGLKPILEAFSKGDNLAVGMGGKVQDLVRNALKYGMELPAGLKPIIEAMIKQGTLTDDNGTKLTDLTKLKFSEDLTTKFDLLITKLGELIGRLGTDIPREGRRGAKETQDAWDQVDLRVKAPWEDWGTAPGGPVDAGRPGPGPGPGRDGGLSFASGGFRDFGLGTTVRLHGLEAIIPFNRPMSAEAAGAVGMLQGGGAAPVIVQNEIHAQLVVEGRVLQEWVVRNDRAVMNAVVRSAKRFVG